MLRIKEERISAGAKDVHQPVPLERDKFTVGSQAFPLTPVTELQVRKPA